MSARHSLLQDVGLEPPSSSKTGIDAVLATIRAAVSNSNIPRFDEIARLIYNAESRRLRADGTMTADVKALVNQALRQARSLDPLLPTGITAFPSYTPTTIDLLNMLNLGK